MKKRNYSVIAKVLVVSSLMCGVLSSCSEVYDDSELLKKLEELGNKLDQHEKSDVAPEDSIIHFDEVAVKAICVSHWDTNHDGELSYGEAAKVDTIGSEFCESSIYMFKELKYFSNLLYIGGGFWYCDQLKIISIPSSVVSIGDDAFRFGNNWRGGEFAVHIDDIEAWCNIYFESYYSNPLSYDYYYRRKSNLYVNGELLTDLIIPNSITGVKDYAFGGCQSLTSVLIPEGISYIGERAFDGCSNLDSITIPKSVTMIGNYAFRACEKLNAITVLNTTPPLLERDKNRNFSIFSYNCRESAILYVPKGCVEVYRNADGWGNFVNIVELE